jgi:glucose/arabinose dehydrogenase
MLRRILSAAVAIVLSSSPASAQLKIQPFVTGFSVPVAFIQDPTDVTVQYVVQQNGHIRVVKSGVVQPTDFLDLSASISGGGERGLLGLAFEPGDVTDRRFYVNFTNPDGHTVIARFLRSTGNRLVADASTRFDLQWPGGNRFIVQPFANHNGGTIVFGPDNYLYIGMGDGGSGNDPRGNAQNPNTLLGKMLRIDVRVALSNTKGYTIPDDNPFLDNIPIPALGEIWSFGLRNPWKFSFDDPARGGSGAMVIADVGQGSYEEVDYQPPNRGARNYGWVNREGAHPTPGISPPPPAYLPLIDPIHEYTHADGISITGGYVYRGSMLGPGYVGRYFFADLTGRVWSIALTVNPSTGEATASGLIEHTAEFGGTSTLGNITSFGVDSAGELYIVGYSKGTIFKVQSAAPAMSLDAPASGAVTQPFTMGGWAIDRRAMSGPGIDAVHLWAFPASGAPLFLSSAPFGGARPDVGAAFGSQYTNSGFSQTIRGLAPGNYTLTASAHSSVAGTFIDGRAVNVNVMNNPRMVNDVPVNGASNLPTHFTLSGWALDLAASSGTGVDTIHVWAYPNPGSGTPPVFLGAAAYGTSRPDVGAAFGAQFTNTGYSLAVSNLAVGVYQLVVFAHSTVSGIFDNAAAVNVTVTADAQMFIDAPAAGTAMRPFLVRGWAIDRGAGTGAGVDAVHVWAYPVSGTPAVFVGAATTGLSRPDVGSYFGSPQFTNSGYSLTVSGLAVGVYDLVVFARSTVTGTFNNARVVRVTVQ